MGEHWAKSCGCQQQVLKMTSSILKADIWANLGFYEFAGKHKLGETQTVCEICLKPRIKESLSTLLHNSESPVLSESCF